MELVEKIFKDKEMLYSLGKKHYDEILENESELINLKEVRNSIYIVVDNDMIQTGAIAIKFTLYQNEDLRNGYYVLYVDENHDFVDEFLVTDF